ncbi:MAG: hypothetical protein DHS20C19_14300 [Acidimicrobiales bacterium]|nr:MAG: hypothetical protein DHS20C19_14300 [Acidimicrobiales bacterium]
MKRISALLAAALLASSLAVIATTTPAGAATPEFELPIGCGITLSADRFSSSFHVFGDVDINTGAGDSDLGEPILAAADGTVTFVEPDTGTTWVHDNLGGVFIDHGDGWVTEYTHLGPISVNSGDTVVKGQKIGEMNKTGYPTYATAVHLHFRVTKDGAGQRPTFNHAGGTTLIEDGGSYVSTNAASANSPGSATGCHSITSSGNDGPTAVSDGHLFVAAIGDDGELKYRSRSESSNAWAANWTDLNSTGALLTGTPSAAKSDGYLFIAGIGGDGEIKYRARNETTNSWGGWSDLDAPSGVDFTVAPALTVSDNHLFAAGIGTDGKLWYRARNQTTNAWTAWTTLDSTGALLYGSPSLAVNDGHLWAAGIGGDGEIKYRARNETTNTWNSWTDLNAPSGVDFVGSPELVVSDGYLFVFATGDNGKTYHRARNQSTNAWGGWSSNPGSPTGDLVTGTPSAAVSDGHLFVAGVADDGDIVYRTRNESTNSWGSNWNVLGSPSGVDFSGSPSLIASDGELFVFGVGTNGNIYHRARNATTNSWSAWSTNPGSPSGVNLSPWLPTDSDGDGVPDQADLCASTPAGHPVNSDGCPLFGDGDFIKVSGSATIYRVAGGAAIPLNSCASLGNCSGTLLISAAQLASLNPVPADGTFLKGDANATIWRIAGGSPLPLTSCGDLGGCGGTVTVNTWSVNQLSNANPTPSDGTYLEGRPSGNQWIVESGCVTPSVTAPSSAVDVNDSSVLTLPACELRRIRPFGVVVNEGDTGSQIVDAVVFLEDANGDPITATEPVSFDWYTGDVPTNPNIAHPGSDFIAASGTATINIGESQTTFPIEILGDLEDEPPLLYGEWGLFGVNNPTSNAIIDTQSFFGIGLFIILDND